MCLHSWKPNLRQRKKRERDKSSLTFISKWAKRTHIGEDNKQSRHKKNVLNHFKYKSVFRSLFKLVTVYRWTRQVVIFFSFWQHFCNTVSSYIFRYTIVKSVFLASCASTAQVKSKHHFSSDSKLSEERSAVFG